jgi:DNA-binding response OmpR family regulator
MRSKSARIAVIDSTTELADRLSERSGRVGPFLVVTHHSPTAPLTGLLVRPPHGVVIGPGVSARNAVELCRIIRGTPALVETLIVVVGSDGRRRQEVLSYEADAFDAGADDFVAAASLPVRLNALLRRRLHGASTDPHGLSLNAKDRVSITVGALTVYELDYGVVIHGKRVDLTAGEFRVLWHLALHPGQTVPVAELVPVDLIGETYRSPTSVRTLVFSLRAKLGAYGGQIETIRRGGYRLVEHSRKKR